MREPRIRERIFALLLQGLLLFAFGGAGATLGKRLDDPLAVAPLATFALAVETAFFAVVMTGAIWRTSMVFVSMPLTQRAMFMRVVRSTWRTAGKFLLASLAFGAGAALSSALSPGLMLLVASLIACAALAIGTFLALFRPAVGIAFLVAAAIGGLVWFDWPLHLTARLGWRIGVMPGMALLIAATVVAITATHLLLPRRYTFDAIIRANTFRMLPGELAVRATNTRWSPRTYALLQLVTRRLDPDDYRGRAGRMIKALMATIVIAWIVRFAFASDISFVLPAFLLAMMLLAVLSHVPEGPNRGDWSHPLIESLPVAGREYGGMLLEVNAISVAFVIALAFAASLLSPVHLPWFIFPAALLLVLMLSVISVLAQSSAYRMDPRRTAWSRFARSAPAVVVTIGVLLALAAIIVAGFTISVTLAVAAGVLLIAALLIASWFWTWRIDERRRFDAEYEPNASGRW